METTSEGFLQKQRLHILLLILLGLLAYSNTFAAPFQFDDYIFVEYRDIESKKAEALDQFITADEIRGPWASRPLLYATFLLNNLMGDFNTWGYHIVNIALHLGNGILLYFLVLMTGKHIGYEGKNVVLVALLSSLIFVIHPIQTETVTMVINRSMLMAAAFYLGGVMLFSKAVTSEGKTRYRYTIGLMLAALLGASSREDFATFPIMLLVYDLFFVSRFRPREVMRHFRTYAAVIPGIVLMGYFALTNTYDKYTDFVGHPLPPDVFMPPLQYALTQFKVHWTYIRLLLFPINQNLDYTYPVSTTLLDTATMLSFLGYIALWGAGLLLAKKRPAAAYGILWFLIILLPISFAITLFGLRLGDPIFEHRLYLPSAGLIVLASLAIARLASWKRTFVAATVALCVALSGAAYARNYIWADHWRLWEDALKKSPRSHRAHVNIANILNGKKRTNEAIEHLEIALEIWPKSGETLANLGVIYMNKRDVDKAIEYMEKAVAIAPALARAQGNLAMAYYGEKNYEKALEHILIASRLEPWNNVYLNEAAETYIALEKKEEAIKYYTSSLWIDKKQKIVLNNLSLLFIETGQKERAIKHLEALVALEPKYAPPRLSLGKLYLELGMPFRAVQHLRTADKLKPGEPEIQKALSEAYESLESTKSPISNLTSAEASEKTSTPKPH